MLVRGGGSIILQRDLCVPQVKQLGCSSFSLLFDDIESEMCPADKRAFSSFAHAQVAVSNEVYQHLEEPENFLFCPTGGLTSIPKRPVLCHFLENMSSAALFYVVLMMHIAKDS